MIKGTSAATIVDSIIAAKGRNLYVVTPLGVGKPVLILNELFKRAKEGDIEHLTIFTALSVNPPSPAPDLVSQRLFGPAYERIYEGCKGLDYATARAKGELPDNVTIESFYYGSGSMISNDHGQQNHRSINYAQTVKFLIDHGMDAFLILTGDAGDSLDLSCNADFGSHLIPYYKDLPLEERPFFAAEVNRSLPIFGPDSQFPRESFDAVLDNPPTEYPIISIPSQPPNSAEYSIGLRVASLIKDEGTIQIGIGKIGEAVAWSLIQRHQNNDFFRKLQDAIHPTEAEKAFIQKWGGLDPFEKGLNAPTEMFVEGIMRMYDAGIVRREVDGFCISGGFYAGSNQFYDRLRHLTEEDRKRIRMMPITFTNLLYGCEMGIYGDEASKRIARKNARFINQAMIFTLGGAACSDGLGDGRVVSGIGGQFDFVTQGAQIQGARSILMASSTRSRRGAYSSNIVLSYGHVSVPRHHRDIVVTEYGIADLRYKTDAEVAAALIEVADREFQDELVEQAIKAKKLPKSYRVPDHARTNTRERINDQLRPFRQDGSIPLAPFGSQYTDIELGLIAAKRVIDSLYGDIRHLKLPDLEAADIKAVLSPPEAAQPYLKRLGLENPETIEERVARALIVYGLKAEEVI